MEKVVARRGGAQTVLAASATHVESSGIAPDGARRQEKEEEEER